MWGKHVESELQEAVKKAKTDTQAKQKAQMVINRLLVSRDDEEESESPDSDEPRPVPKGRFADPAARMNKR